MRLILRAKTSTMEIRRAIRSQVVQMTSLLTRRARRKAELFAWADRVIHLGEAELELELDDAAKRFGRARSVCISLLKSTRTRKRLVSSNAVRLQRAVFNTMGATSGAPKRVYSPAE